MSINTLLNIYGTNNYGVLSYIVHHKNYQIESLEYVLDGIGAKIYGLCDFSTDYSLSLIEIILPSTDKIDTWINFVLSESRKRAFPLTWLMFDGAFGSCDDCFSEWQKNQTYALVSPEIEVVYKKNLDDLKDEKWQLLVSQAEIRFKELSLTNFE